ncbi:MAG: hypothetical protein U9N12_05835 [Euryarchaeota archaeon]|nr:hypothetical protein [Euryarchaeota archaeon]
MRLITFFDFSRLYVQGAVMPPWCWRGFEGVVDLSLVLTAPRVFEYPENRSFNQTSRNVTAQFSRKPLRGKIEV